MGLYTITGYTTYHFRTYGERVRKVTPEGISWYITAGNGQVLSEYDGYGNLKYNYIYGNREMLARINFAGEKEFFHNDYLGSVRRISDQNSDLVWSRYYYPFGDTVGYRTRGR